MQHKVIATLLVRDESDIVEDCIAHHLKHGVDGFIITDNNSQDNTAEICRRHPACLQFISETTNNYNQSMWVTRMARMAVDYGATWVLNIDADEFWYGADYLTHISKHIMEISVLKNYKHVITTPIPAGKFNRAFEPYCYPARKHKWRRYPFTYYKTLHRASREVVVQKGNHRINAPWDKSFAITDRRLPFLNIHHFPDRSYERFVLKCRNAETGCINGRFRQQHPWHQYHTAYKNNTVRELYTANIYSITQLNKALATNKLIYKLST